MTLHDPKGQDGNPNNFETCTVTLTTVWATQLTISFYGLHCKL